jgi:hypothetical protein
VYLEVEMFKKNKMGIIDNVSIDTFSNKLENIITKLKENETKDVKNIINGIDNNLRLSLNMEIEKIYLPALENFKGLLKNYSIMSEIEREIIKDGKSKIGCITRDRNNVSLNDIDRIDCELITFIIWTEINIYQNDEENYNVEELNLKELDVNDLDVEGGICDSFYIYCFFKGYDHDKNIVEKPILISEDECWDSPNEERYNLNELSQEIINEKLLLFFEKLKLTKTTIKIIEDD